MTELLLEKIKKYVTVADKDAAILDTYFHPITIPKGDYLLKPGEVFHAAAFVQTGLFRSFIVDENGVEHTLQFSLPGWWAGDLGSFISGKQSKLYSEALEDSEILTIKKNDWDNLLKEVPFYMDYHRKLLEKGLISTQNRLLESYSVDAKKKYIHFLEIFPDILKRVPQYMIASYLGMSRETLSRIRKQIAERK